jgi:hypothetical protein
MKPRLPLAMMTTTWRSSAEGVVVDDWPNAVAALRCSLSFASFYVYAPRGEGFASAAARLVCQRVKASDPQWVPRYARQVVEVCARERRLAQLFARDVWLVPVPGCAPACTRSWAAAQLAMALHELGLGRDVWPAITRRMAVTRSATALQGERPTVQQHFASFGIAAAPPGVRLRRIVLVDDVITKGRTLFAAAARLRCAFPHADIRAAALVRTAGFLSRLDRALAPCEGVVYWAGGDARREP